MSSGSELPPARRNPFSNMAVAKIRDFTGDGAVDLTVETDSIRLATSFVSAYLAAPPPGAHQRGGSDVIALLGDYGTGKTHLALRLVRHAGQVLGDPARAMYLDAPADNFRELYRRFMYKLGLDSVRKQVSDYYADIVAESLRDSGLTSDVVELLRARERDPQQVVEGLGLMESALLREVRHALRQVTANADFGTALTLLLRPGFDDVVWAWLTGGNPHPVLVERGITRPIRSEADALEAMGVFVLLYGGRRGKFLLVVDELDKIFSGADQPQTDITAAFQTFLEKIGDAGACLVLSGLPEFHGMLGPSVRDRIPHVVEMTSLSTDEVCAFIRRAHLAEFGRDELEPFTRDSARYLRDVAGGNAREVIRICHDTFRMADDEIRRTGDPHTLVTDDMVREAARARFGLLSTEDIDARLRRLLDANGWTYLHQHYLSGNAESKADFWVTFADRAGGCALLITRSILDSADFDTMTRRLTAIRGAVPDAEVIVIINGVLTDLMAAQLRETLGCEALVFIERSFDENLRALLGMVSKRLVRDGDSDPLHALRQRVDQIARQQSGLYGIIEQLAEQVDGVRTASARQLTAIHRDLSQWARARQTASTVEPEPGSTLPAEVEGLFQEAVDALDELTEFEVMLPDAFDEETTRTREPIQRRLRTDSYFDAVGVATAARTTVLAFRTAVEAWYGRVRPGSGRPLSGAAEAGLDAICRTYDDISEFIPLFRLEALFGMPPWDAGGAVAGDRHRLARRRRVSTALDGGFSLRVRQAVLRSAVISGG